MRRKGTSERLLERLKDKMLKVATAGRVEEMRERIGPVKADKICEGVETTMDSLLDFMVRSFIGNPKSEESTMELFIQKDTFRRKLSTSEQVILDRMRRLRETMLNRRSEVRNNQAYGLFSELIDGMLLKSEMNEYEPRCLAIEYDCPMICNQRIRVTEGEEDIGVTVYRKAVTTVHDPGFFNEIYRMKKAKGKRNEYYRDGVRILAQPNFAKMENI